MGWFGWKPGRDGSRPALSRAGAAWAGAAGPWSGGYEAQVREGYGRNAVAQRAVRLVVEGAASAPVDAADPALGVLIRPAMLEAVATHLLLHGNAFIQLLRDGDGRLRELYPLRPERVTVEPGADGWPAAYVYRAGGAATRIDTAAIVHLRRLNPLDDHYGLGCLAAAAGAVAIHNAASVWAKALLDNAARPSGALVYDPGDGSVLSPDQFRRLKEEMDAGFAGAANAGRPMLLEGGLKWQALGLSPADMDFAGTKDAAAREIALAFGVPPMLLGLPGDSTHANYREANKALWRLTILPLIDMILSGLSVGLAADFADHALTVDLDRVPALVEDRERLWRMVAGASFISDAEKRQMVGWQ